MDIESKLKREGGSRIQLGATEYHFAPGDDGAHVAAVDDDEHVATLLAIPEGFRIYKPTAMQDAQQSNGGDIGQTSQESKSDSDDPTEAEIAALRADLAAQFEAKFGKKPHYNLSIDKLRNALMSVQNDQG